MQLAAHKHSCESPIELSSLCCDKTYIISRRVTLRSRKLHSNKAATTILFRLKRYTSDSNRSSYPLYALTVSHGAYRVLDTATCEPVSIPASVVFVGDTNQCSVLYSINSVYAQFSANNLEPTSWPLHSVAHLCTRFRETELYSLVTA